MWSFRSVRQSRWLHWKTLHDDGGKSECRFIILVEKLFDRSFAHGYSFQRSEVHVQKLRPHNLCEAAKPALPSIRRQLATWSMRFSYGPGLVGDTGTCGGPPRT